MLQKKLLARLGLLVIGFVIGAVVAISLLQSVLGELNTVSSQAQGMLDAVQDTTTKVAQLETVIEQVLPSNNNSTPYALAASSVVASLVRLQTNPFVRDDAGITEAFLRSQELARGIDSQATRSTLQAQRASLLSDTRRLRDEVNTVAALARKHMGEKQSTLSSHLRALIIGLTVAALVMTNIAIFVLLRTATMILRPVGQLIVGSRELAQERFDFRIEMSQKGEFGELAAAYNSLAAQLASNEQKKVKALQQLAVTLNHELNNALNAIELQLTLVNRRAGADPQLSAHLGNIQSNLNRMAQTIASLKNVRRVVLTDYLPGEPMLDLPRSTAAEEITVSVRPSTSPVQTSKN